MTSIANAPLPRGQAGLATIARNRQVKTAAAAALPRPLVFIDSAYAKHKGSHKFLIFTNPSAANADYPNFVRTALTNAWQILKPLWQKGFRARIAIDFKDRGAQGLPNPPWATDTHSTVVYDLVDKERTQELLEYWTHDVTSLEAPHSEAERVVRSLDQMKALAVPHLANRVALELHYNEMDALQQSEQQPLFRTPVHLIVTLWRTGFDRSIPIGDRGTNILLERLLTQNTAPPGDCVFQAMINQFEKERPALRRSGLLQGTNQNAMYFLPLGIVFRISSHFGMYLKLTFSYCFSICSPCAEAEKLYENVLFSTVWNLPNCLCGFSRDVHTYMEIKCSLWRCLKYRPDHCNSYSSSSKGYVCIS